MRYNPKKEYQSGGVVTATAQPLFQPISTKATVAEFDPKKLKRQLQQQSGLKMPEIDVDDALTSDLNGVQTVMQQAEALLGDLTPEEMLIGSSRMKIAQNMINKSYNKFTKNEFKNNAAAYKKGISEMEGQDGFNALAVDGEEVYLRDAQNNIVKVSIADYVTNKQAYRDKGLVVTTGARVA